MNKNTYITYDMLLSLVNDYFRMTWWEDFLSYWTIEMIVNLSIQDVLNQSWYTYLSEFETVKDSKEMLNWRYKVFYTKYPIEIIHEVLIDWKWESANIVNRLPSVWSDEVYYRKWTNEVYVHWTDIKFIAINYNRAYEYQVLWQDTHRDKIIPLPFSYVPALIKMIYDNASLYTYFQWDWTYTDFYWHSISRINKLVEQDKLSTKENIII